MAESKARTLAGLTDTAGDIKSTSLDNVAAGLTVYATKENLPATGLTSGDQAYVTNTSRLYISNGSGWYNIALINATPSLSIDPTGAIALSKEGTATTITLTGTDSDNAVAGLTYSVESDGSFGGLATLSQDSSVFTITPLSEDSATTASAVLTFKASDGINFGSGDRTLTLSFKVANSNYTTLLLQADSDGTDNQVDASSNSHTITENGNVTSTAFTPHHPGGYSAYFSANNLRVYTNGNSADFNLSNNDWTYEGWFYVPADHTFTTYPRAFGLGPYYNNAASFGAMFTDPDQSGYMTVYWHDGTQGRKLISATTYEKGKWNHVAICREGNAIALFYNGTRIANNASYTGTINGNNTYAYVGHTGNGTEGFTGYFKDVRLINGSSAYDPTLSSITVPSETLTAVTDTKLLLAATSYFKDTSLSNHSLINGISKIERFGPYDYLGYKKADHGGSVYFDGTGDKMSIANSADFNLSSGSWTIECWVYLTGSYSKYHALFAKRVSGGGVSTSMEGYIKQTTGALSWYDGTERVSTGIIQPNTWSHCAWTHNGTNLKMFLNGENVYDAAISVTEIDYPLYIGGLNGLTGEDLEGYISDFRVVKGTEVYTADFTPPTAPLTAITNTQLLTCTNKNDIWDAGSGNLLTKAGDVTASNTQRKFTTSSAVYFDGTNDHLEITDMGISGDLTFEFWFYQDVAQSAAYRWLFGTDTYGASAPIGVYTYSSNVQVWLDGSGSADISGAFTAQTWHHVAVVRNSGTWTLYIDGTSQGTSTVAGSTNFADTVDWWIGERSNGSYDFNGYMQDIRFTKGLARYTAAFTPPTAEFKG